MKYKVIGNDPSYSLPWYGDRIVSRGEVVEIPADLTALADTCGILKRMDEGKKKKEED